MSDLIEVWVYPTRSCNFKCTYCYEHHDTSYMSADTAVRTVDWAFAQASRASARGVALSFFGGEPLLNFRSFQQVVLHAQEVAKASGKAVTYRMNTNGSLIDDEVADFLVEHRVGLDFSLDGDQQTNDTARLTRSGASAYEAAGGIEKVVRLHARGLDVGVNMVVGPDSVRRLVSNVRFFWEHGVTGLQVLPMFKGGRDWTEEDLAELDQAFGQIASDIVRGIAETGRFELLNFAPFSKVIELMRQAEAARDAEALRAHTYCGIGRRNFSVDVNGNLYSCPRFIHDVGIDRTSRDLLIGNIKTRVYNLTVVNHFKEWNPRSNPKSICYTCPHVLTCVYQCVAENMAWTGDEYSVAPVVCQITEIVNKYAAGLRTLYPPAPAPQERAQPAAVADAGFLA
ncbi:MAG: radical SAM protein [Vicinamibacterales bacterium]